MSTNALMIIMLNTTGILWLVILSAIAWADEVISIDQNLAMAGGVTPGDAPGFPITLSRPSKYRLKSNLVIDMPGKNVIEITAPNVIIDLNNYTIGGSQGAQGAAIMGIVNVMGSAYTTVLNGTVTGMGSDGLNLSLAAHVENVRAISNGGSGIATGNDSMIKDCTMLYNNLGIFCHSGCVLINNRVTGSSDAGISVSNGGLIKENLVNNNTYGVVDRNEDIYLGGSLIIDNIVYQNRNFGLILNRNSRYMKNILVGNNGGDPDSQLQGGVEISKNLRSVEDK